MGVAGSICLNTAFAAFFLASLSKLQREQNMAASLALESGTYVYCSREPNYSVSEVPVLPQIPLMFSGTLLDLSLTLACCSFTVLLCCFFQEANPITRIPGN